MATHPWYCSMVTLVMKPWENFMVRSTSNPYNVVQHSSHPTFSKISTNWGLLCKKVISVGSFKLNPPCLVVIIRSFVVISLMRDKVVMFSLELCSSHIFAFLYFLTTRCCRTITICLCNKLTFSSYHGFTWWEI